MKASSFNALSSKIIKKPTALFEEIFRMASAKGKSLSARKMKNNLKSSDFTSIISTLVHKTLVNTQLENEVD